MNIRLLQKGNNTNCCESLLNEWDISADTFNEMVALGQEMFLDKDDSEPQTIVSNIILSDEEPYMDFAKDVEKLERTLKVIEEISDYHLSDSMFNFLKSLLNVFADNHVLDEVAVGECVASMENACNSTFPIDILKKSLNKMDYDERYPRSIAREMIPVLYELIEGYQTDNILETRFFNELEEKLLGINSDIESRKVINDLKKAIIQVIDNVFPMFDVLTTDEIIKTIRYHQVKISLLGEYRKKDRSIILYYRNIEKSAKSNSNDKCNLLKIVFFHELVHAILHPTEFTDNSYISKLEEPVCEYGMLCLAKAYNKGALFDTAMEHVQAKQACCPLFHYGFGSYIYNREQLDSNGSSLGIHVNTIYELKYKYLKKYSNFQIPAVGSKEKRSSFEVIADKFDAAFLGKSEYPCEKQSALYEELIKRVKL